MSARGGWCLQIAAYAEFRQDWAAALKYYRSAYSSLQDLSLAKDARRFQHIAEATAVAEQIHFKLCTISLHSGRCARALLAVWSCVARVVVVCVECAPGSASLCLTNEFPWCALCAASRRPFHSSVSTCTSGSVCFRLELHPSCMQHMPCGALASIVPSQSCWQHARQPLGRVGPLNGALFRRKPSR